MANKKEYETPAIEEIKANGEDLDELIESSVFSENEAEDKPAFTINSDSAAEWALQKIKAKRERLERLKALAEAQKAEIDAKIEREQKKYENGTAYLKGKLLEYFETVPHEKTKTEEKYALLTGTLKLKKPAQKFEHDDATLLEWLENNQHKDLIKYTGSPKWAEVKKLLKVTSSGVVVIKDSGEIVGGVTASETPAEFDVKF